MFGLAPKCPHCGQRIEMEILPAMPPLCSHCYCQGVDSTTVTAGGFRCCKCGGVVHNGTITLYGNIVNTARTLC